MRVSVVVICLFCVNCGKADGLIPPNLGEPIISIEVRSETTNEPLWKITAQRELALAEVQYGEVPPGFRQVLPQPPRIPRELHATELIWIRIENKTSWLERECEARSARSVTCGYYRAGQIERSLLKKRP